MKTKKKALEEVWVYLSRLNGDNKISAQVQVIDKEETTVIPSPFYYMLGMLNPYQYVSALCYPTKHPMLTLVVEYQGIYGQKFCQKFSVNITPNISHDDSGKANEVYRIDFFEVAC